MKKYGTPKTPADLKEHQLLQYSISGATSWKLRDKKGERHSINLSAKIKANNGDFLRDMAIAGHGIVSSPTFIAWKAIATGDLVPVLTDYKLPQPSAHAVYPQTRYLSQRTRMLIDFLVERFGENPYWDQSLGVADK